MRDALAWLLISAIWYLIGLVLTDWIPGLLFLLFPLGIGLVAGIILARLKHHQLHDLIEHDELEMAVSVTAGAVAFIATLLLVTLLLPADGQLALTTLYWLLATPAGILLAATTYLSAKTFAKHTPSLGGLMTSLAFSAVLILFGGALVATATSGVHEQHYSETQLPDSEIEILSDLAQAHHNINRWHVNPDLEPLTEASIISVHAVIRTMLSNQIKDDYIKAQELVRTPPNITSKTLTSHPCHELLATPVEHNKPQPPNILKQPETISEHVMYKVAKASTLDEMTSQIQKIIARGQQQSDNLYRARLADTPTNESSASRAARNQLLIDYLDTECEQQG